MTSDARLQASLSGFEALTAMPMWLPGETLFSLVSRYHVLSGNRLPSTTCRVLFGHPRQGAQHDLPSRLGEFSTRTRGIWGDPVELAMTRTLLPFYLPLCSRVEASAHVQALVEPIGGMLKFRLGILTSRFRANHPLKACRACMADDVSAFGTTYWHLAHQIPGVWICRHHHLGLCESKLKSTGVSRFGWVLPTPGELNRGPLEAASALTSAAFSSFAGLACDWLRCAGSLGLSSEGMARAYRFALTRSANAKRVGGEALREGALLLTQKVAPLRCAPELVGLPADEERAMVLLARWTRKPRGGTHPLNHLGIIFSLFGSWPAFVECYETAAHMARDDLKLGTEPSEAVADPRRQRLVTMLAQGTSASTAARSLGIATQTAICWAAQMGVQTPRRPKVLKDADYAKLVAALGAGEEKAKVATSAGVSLETITRVLRSEVGLHGRREPANPRGARGFRQRRNTREPASASQSRRCRQPMPGCAGMIVLGWRLTALISACPGAPTIRGGSSGIGAMTISAMRCAVPRCVSLNSPVRRNFRSGRSTRRCRSSRRS
jgi:hypothetical protein